MIKKALLIFVLILTAPFALATEATDSNTQATTSTKDSHSESFLEKSGDAIKAGADKTKTFIKDNFNGEKLDAFGKKAANATKKTWNDTKDASKSLMDSFKSDKTKRSSGAKKESAGCTSCQKQETKKACACSCKCN